MANPTPETALTATQILSLIGAITGPIGTVVSLLVYFRDRAKVRVVLAFDMQGFGALPKVPEMYFAVRIFNIGRRPIYLDLAHIVFPKSARKQTSVTHFLLSSGVQGVKLNEGDAPHVIPARQTQLAKSPALLSAGARGRCRAARTEHLPGRQRPGDALHVDGVEIAVFEEIAEEPARTRVRHGYCTLGARHALLQMELEGKKVPRSGQ